jgi:agmatinase
MSEHSNSNFGGLPKEYSELGRSRVVVVPVPYDETSTYMKGADKGPEAILKASAAVELYDIETDSEVYREGIFTDKPVLEKSSPEKMVDAVEKRIGQHLDAGKFVVTLGGEHSISTGCVRAHLRKHPGMSVLQLDAHSDLRQEYEGSKYNHACVMARIKEQCPIVQVGIRSMDASEKPSIDKKRVFFAHDIAGRTDWIDRAVAQLGEEVYVTIDLDVFDPAVMPSTGTPEPGGLYWYEVTALLAAVCRQRKVVGFDVVEMCPVKQQWAPDFLAAKLVYKFLTLVYGSR